MYIALVFKISSKSLARRYEFVGTFFPSCKTFKRGSESLKQLEQRRMERNILKLKQEYSETGYQCFKKKDAKKRKNKAKNTTLV